MNWSLFYGNGDVVMENQVLPHEIKSSRDD